MTLIPAAPVEAVETVGRFAKDSRGFGTKAVQAGAPHDPVTGAVIEPITLSTTFAQTSVGYPVGLYEYTRSSNPNRDNFEHALAALENARYALAFSSGLAATSVVLQALAAGGHLISVSDLYGGTHRYFTKVAKTHGITASFTTALAKDLRGMLEERKDTKLVWIETPGNPTLGLVDIRAVADVAHEFGVLLLVDNTFLSPYAQNPLEHGADIVLHSVTKYINGHSDVLMGALAFNSAELNDKLSYLQNAIGCVPSPFDCWLAHRGLKTLHLRARQASENALAIATALEASPNVVAVNYPGLDSHPHRAIAVKQHRKGLGGGMVSFRIRGGQAAALKFCEATRIFTLAESLGGVESLCEVPASMTHAGIPREDRERSGVFDDLIRLSVGIEETEDLVEDVLGALQRAADAVGLKPAAEKVEGSGSVTPDSGVEV
ncbi:Cys/Met metabolism PLP-dependent enzyme-domain-containing protein [Geopyxis carbonaria]|nr:Cys/Met metabolism PLP-dependent enzyme-domain-containing protein [Geopyxis carbonaria]